MLNGFGFDVHIILALRKRSSQGGSMKNTSISATGEILLEYQNHLIHTAGHQSATCKAWTFYARRFLQQQFGPKARFLNWNEVQPLTLLHFFSEQKSSYSPFRLQLMATALRSFCRFLRLRNYCAQDWSSGIPRICAGARESLRSYLSSEQLAQLLAGPETFGSSPLRDFAIIVCLARLGLRAGEVAELTLDNLNWGEAVLSLDRTKGRRARRFPMTKGVGDALARYLRKERPAVPDRHVFLSRQHHRPLSADTVSLVVTKNLKRLGLPPGGAHLLRRTMATHLVQQGASIKEVADLLGHKSLATTMVYTQVNLPMLKQVIMPWLTEAGR